MELINNTFEQEQEVRSNFRTITKGQKFVRIVDEETESDEEKSFYDLPKNIGKTFISKNRIY